MPNKKENILGKIVRKNYDEELEKVLETKKFDENVNNILPEILYKIETSYKDYKKVKRDVESKEQYINNFIEIIDKKCDEIQIIVPNSEESKKLNNRTFLVDRENKKILCFPMQRKILYCIAKIDKQNQIVHRENILLNKTLSNVINIGNSINMVEPLRNFNGWSWAIIKKEIENIEYNLIYQNLRILVGNDLLINWTKNKQYIVDYYEIFKNALEEQYSKEIEEKIISSLEKISILIERKLNSSIESEIEEQLRKNETFLQALEDKQQYIEKLTKEKTQIKNRIKEIETIIVDKNKLNAEYERRIHESSSNEKIFSMRSLIQVLISEEEELKKQLEEKNNLLNPMRFLQEKEKVENNYELLQKSDLEEELLEFQKRFLEAFNLKVEKVATKEEIINIIYNFRYYQMLPFNENTSIYENEELRDKLYKIEEKILKKSISNKIINERMEKEIFHYIFRTQIISLEEIYIKVNKNNDKIIVELSEEDSKEYGEKFEINKEEINEDNIFRSYKNGHRFKLFN